MAKQVMIAAYYLVGEEGGRYDFLDEGHGTAPRYFSRFQAGVMGRQSALRASAQYCFRVADMRGALSVARLSFTGVSDGRQVVGRYVRLFLTRYRRFLSSLFAMLDYARRGVSSPLRFLSLSHAQSFAVQQRVEVAYFLLHWLLQQ